MRFVEDWVVEDWVKEIVDFHFGGQPFEVGDTVKHPSGRTVQITGGQYWTKGGLSNLWSWREVLPEKDADGRNKLGPQESGYGWDPKVIA